MTSTYNANRNHFVPEFRKRKFYRPSLIVDKQFTATNGWWKHSLSGDEYIITAEWHFGRTADGTYLAEKIEDGLAVDEKPVNNYYQQQSLLSWYEARDWIVESAKA